MKPLIGAIVVLFLAGTCAAGSIPPRGPSILVPSGPSSASRSAAPAPTATVEPPAAARCARNGATALAGVADVRPEGWFDRTDSSSVANDPKTSRTVYAAAGVPIPPDEGPGRLVLYETAPGNDQFFRGRVDQSRRRGGSAVTVMVCGEHTEVWVNPSDGELVLGWTDRDKTDVLVANTADFTVDSLVEVAEGVSDCCG
jgi:hypothetical protein